MLVVIQFRTFIGMALRQRSFGSELSENNSTDKITFNDVDNNFDINDKAHFGENARKISSSDYSSSESELKENIQSKCSGEVMKPQ